MRDYVIKRHGKPVKVLDHGHVRVVDVMGDDQAVVQAARVSYGAGLSSHVWDGDIEGVGRNEIECTVCSRTYGCLESAGGLDHCIEGDAKLIRFLVRRGHTSPLEMCEIKLHIRMPIFVARHWVRHRTASINEYSMRYSPAIEDCFLVGVDKWRGQSESSKQCSEGYIGASIGRSLTDASAAIQKQSLEEYKRKIAYGTARELARCDLPLSMYTEWYWKTDLHNLLNFVRQRESPHAQEEIREYALAIEKIIADWVPSVWSAFKEYVLNAHTFSGAEMALLAAISAGRIMPDWHKDKENRVRVFSAYGIETVRERVDFLNALKHDRRIK